MAAEIVTLNKIARRLGFARQRIREQDRIIYELRRELEQAQRDNRIANDRYRLALQERD
jgi:hypothetical protein